MLRITIKKGCILVLLLIMVALVANLSMQSNRVSRIPAQDREILRQFFYRILYKEGLIYVLCGSKPMGTACYTSSLAPEMDSEPINRTLKDGWKTWCKYQRLFPHKKLIFRVVGSEEKNCTIKILLIHRDHFRKALTQNRKIFENVLGKKIDIDLALKSFECDDDPIKNVLKNNHLLLGILYGFGVHNSQNFLVRWEQMEKLRSQFKSQKEMFESLEIPQIDTLESENHPILNLPIFAVDPADQETKELRDQYQKERAEILKKIENKDLLEVVLNEWK